MKGGYLCTCMSVIKLDSKSLLQASYEATISDTADQQIKVSYRYTDTKETTELKTYVNIQSNAAVIIN